MSADPCPTCGRSDLGCAAREVGAFCRAPPRRPPVRVVVNVPWWSTVRLGRAVPAEDAIVKFTLRGELERLPCLLCGELVAVVVLPTGARLAVTDASGVVHDVTCKGAG